MEFLSQNYRKKSCGDQYWRPFKQNGALSGLFMVEPVKDTWGTVSVHSS
jgi:hypothetical protein